jgi:hypothetical protein
LNTGKGRRSRAQRGDSIQKRLDAIRQRIQELEQPAGPGHDPQAASRAVEAAQQHSEEPK